jgi:pimeloyl-ACP methyl ester carboxylesterase
MPAVRINGITMYYEIHGEGIPLVLIMGLRRNLEWWYRQIPALAGHFKVIAFDNRGAGRTDKPDSEYSIRLFADDTACLMDALGVPEAHVLGVSMGGYIAQELAIACPGKVKSLILGCTGSGGRRAALMQPERLTKFTANEGLTPAEILRKDMDIYFSDAFMANQPDDVENFVSVSLKYYQPADAFLRQFAACREHDTTDRLGAIRAPVLLATGDDDPLVPAQNTLILKELLPASRLEIFPRCRHVFFIEEADRFNRLVIEFIFETEGAAA